MPELQEQDAVDEPLTQELQDAIQDMISKMMARERFSRIWEIRDSQKQRFFERGIQHIIWNGVQNCYQISGTTGASSWDDSSASNQPNYNDDFNIYLGYEKSFCAVFSQNQASTRAEPDNPKEAMDVAAAREAEKFKRVIEKSSDHKETQRHIARFLWTDRRVVSWSRYEIDGKRFGYDVDGQPKGGNVTEVFGTLESKVPITSRGIFEWPYCQIATEKDITVCKDKFANIAKKIIGASGGSSDELIARNARIAVSEGTFLNGQSGDSVEYLVTESHSWFRPSFYKTQSEDVEAQLLEMFPEGLHATFVDNIFAKAEAARMEDEIAIMHALPGDGQSRVSIGSVMVPVQENFNDLMNQAIEIYDYCIPQKWVDEEGIDIDAIQEQVSQPGEYRPYERKTGESMADHFFEETAVTVPADMAGFMKEISGPLSQFLTAQQPSLMGAEMKGAGETAKGYQMAAQQALGVMGLIWAPYTVFYSTIMGQSIKSAAKAKIEEVSMTALVPRGNGKSEQIDIDLQDLAQGNFKFSPEVDAQFPESWSQQRQVYFQLEQQAGNNPALQAELMQPDNLAIRRDLIGIEGFVIAGAESRDKQLAEIDEMIKGPGPMPNPAVQQAAQGMLAAAQTGEQPPAPVAPLISSIPINPRTDDSATEWKECLRYINSPEGQKLKTEKPEQFQDILLHCYEHEDAMNAKLMQQAMQAQAMQPQGAAPNA